MQLVLILSQMINYAVDEVEKNYKGLVIGNQGEELLRWCEPSNDLNGSTG